MVWDGHEWFGAIATNTVTVSAASTPNASVFSCSIPSSMVAGQQYPVSITMNNTGGMAWSSTSPISLGAVGDGSGVAIEFGADRYGIPSGTIVQPGQTYTFNFTVTVPSTPGTYSPEWQMVWDGHEWFGAIANKTVSVVAASSPSATVTAFSIPGSVLAGGQYSVSITMSNTGNMNWSSSSPISLGAVGDGSGVAIEFGADRYGISSGTIVQPGQTYTFNFTVTAPSTPGTYSPEWQMVWDGHEWFGAIATNTVTVS
jgi:hypothetical protein